MRMTALRIWIAVMLLALVCAASALAVQANYGTGPVRAEANWPAGLAELLNSQQRVYAACVTFWDHFYYAGDTAAFNAFLKRYSQLASESHVLLLHPGQGTTKAVVPDLVSGRADTFTFDWEVTDATRVHPNDVALDLWLGGQVRQPGIVIPANVQVRFDKDLKESDISPLLRGPAEGAAQLLKDYREAKLGQIALVVKDLSQGKSRLLIGQGAGANPQVGHVLEVPESGGLPFISAYPVSQPARTKLNVGNCALVGAVALPVGAEPPGARGSAALGRIPMAPAGVYLLAYTGEFSDREEEPGTMSLMSVSVDKDGNPVFRQILGVPATRHTRPADVTYDGEDWYGASVRFPNKDQVSGENPAWRATVTLALHEPDGRYRGYEFRLDLQVIME